MMVWNFCVRKILTASINSYFLRNMIFLNNLLLLLKLYACFCNIANDIIESDRGMTKNDRETFFYERRNKKMKKERTGK